MTFSFKLASLNVKTCEDTLVIIAFTDQRAADLGFKATPLPLLHRSGQVGERIVHVNGVPVPQPT